jgi:NodT family efflux transporter outer membrane factor (OMF) lipoprotein
MRRSIALFAALLPTLLSACVATPPTVPQVAPLASSTLGLGTEAAPQLPDDWWKGFNDPQIDRLAVAMLSGNPTLASALARIRAAQAQVSGAEASDLPQVTLDGSEERTLFSGDYIIPPPYAGSWRWYGQVAANFSWNLDFWGKQAALIEKAKDTAQAASYDAAAARLALSGVLAETYINLMLAYQNGDIADATVTERQEILRLTEGRVQAGLENESALEEAKAILSQAKGEQMRLAALRQMDIHAIAALTGQAAAAYNTITRPTPSVDVALPLPTSLPADLLARRPDILAARARIDAAMQGRTAAHAAFYPDINLEALAGFQAIGLSSLITGNSFTTGVGPAIHLPIFDAGKLRADYAGATATLDVAVADYNGAVLSAVKQTADAMTQVQDLAARRAEQQNTLAASTRAFDLAEQRYSQGLSPQLPVLIAEASVLQARQQMAGLIAEGITQRVTLLLAAGGTFHDTQLHNDQTNIAKQD